MEQMQGLDLPPGFAHFCPGFDDLPPGFGGPSLRPAVPLRVAPTPVLQGRAKRPRPRKVTWALGHKLCDVRLFAAEDAPNLVGAGHQDRLKAKISKFMHTASPVTRGDVSPGYGEKQMPKRLVDEAAVKAIVAQVAWRRPPACKLDTAWAMVAGEASEEVKVQQVRQVRILEAVYPRLSAIPSNPGEPQEPPQGEVKDEDIPQIPVVAVEEDAVEAVEGAAGPAHIAQKVCVQGSQMVSIGYGNGMYGLTPAAWYQCASQGSNRVVQLPVAANVDECARPLSGFEASKEKGVPNAESVVAEAVVKSREAGSLIDSELLLNMLRNPSLIEALLGKNGSVDASNLLQTSACAPPLAHSAGPQESRVEFQHSAPAFVQHPSLPPLAYPASTQVQGGHMSTSWR